MSAFVARFEGTCTSCFDPIEGGDRVLYVDDDLVHEACEGRAMSTPVERVAVVCTSCFIEKPCGCEDGQ